MEADRKARDIDSRLKELYAIDVHYWGGEDNDDDLNTLVDQAVIDYTQPRIAKLEKEKASLGV